MHTTHVNTGLYHLNTSDIDYDVAHLYEHLVIASFTEHLRQEGHPYYLYGWLHARTFQGVVFVEYGFYDEVLVPLLADFLSSKARINLDILDSELARIQSEDRSVITTFSRSGVMRQFAQLDEREFVDHAESFQSFVVPHNRREASSVLALKYAPKKFRDITVSAHLNEPSPEEMIAFLRLRPLILDALDIGAQRIGGYHYSSTASIRQTTTGELSTMAIYDIPRSGLRTSQIKSRIDTAIQELSTEIQSHPEAVAKYREAFVTTPGWHGFPMDYFTYTSIVTSRHEIAKCFTPERITGMLSRLCVHVQATTSDDYEMVKRHS